jgi:hypothetical protein
MATIEDVTKSWASLNFIDEVLSTMSDMSRELADQNRLQLKKGQTAKGGKFNEYASDTYASMKNRMNPLPGFGNPDLFLTGKFASEIRLIVSLSEGDMGSTDTKESKLESMYGADNIFGLNDESLGEVKNDFANKLVDNIKANIGI